MVRITSFITRRRRRRASIAGNTRRRVRRAGSVSRDTGAVTTWTKRAAVLGVISASLGLGTAIVHLLPTSPSPPAVVVIYPPSPPVGGTGETPPDGISGRGDHPADDRDRCPRLGNTSPWLSPSWRPSASPRRSWEDEYWRYRINVRGGVGDLEGWELPGVGRLFGRDGRPAHAGSHWEGGRPHSSASGLVGRDQAGSRPGPAAGPGRDQ